MTTARYETTKSAPSFYTFVTLIITQNHVTLDDYELPLPYLYFVIKSNYMYIIKFTEKFGSHKVVIFFFEN